MRNAQVQRRAPVPSGKRPGNGKKIKAKLDTAQKECIRIAALAARLQQENSLLKRIFRNIEAKIDQFKKEMEEK